ncbi:hypothetical protein [Lacipirellula limnantheis]|nr:hypothetical protein [Lacipirellula limnantheis]
MAGAPVSSEAVARGLVDTLDGSFLPRNAPRGDVGRFTDLDIAEGIGWVGEEARLIEILLDAGIFARHEEHRLVRVDYHRLAPNFIRASVNSAGGFVTGPEPGSKHEAKGGAKAPPKTTAEAAPESEPGTAFSIQSLPILTNPSSDPIDDGDGSNFVEGVDEVILDAKTFEEIKPDCARVADLVRIGRSPLNDADSETVIRCVVVARQRLPKGELDAIIKRVRKKSETVRLQSKIGYFKTAIITACEKAGVDFHFASKFDLPRRQPNETTVPEGAVA